MKRGFSFWCYFIHSIFSDIYEWIIRRVPFRRKLCWMFGHRYKGKRIDDGENPDVEAWVADTDKGCIYCGHKQRSMFG